MGDHGLEYLREFYEGLERLWYLFLVKALIFWVVV
jgi:hypothetical protein